MTATFTSFITAITGMVVSGVSTRLTAPPASLSTADIPCSFPMLPSGNVDTLVFGNGLLAGGSQPTITCDLIFVYEAFGQNTFATNYSGLLTLLDAIVTASKSLTRPGAGPMTFSLRMGTINIAGNDYFAIYETWTGVG